MDLPASERPAGERTREERGPLLRPVPAAPLRCLVVLPTYNERQNLPVVVAAIRERFETDILVVDDGSPDGTGQEADRMAARDPRLLVLHRTGKQGLGTAYLAGFGHAIQHGYDRVFEMDADLSHDPADLPRLLQASLDADLVIGSRYVRGGSTEGWTFRRRLLSRGANLYARLFLGGRVRDWTGGYRCFDVAALRTIDFGGIAAQGYAFQVEMAWRFVKAGLRVTEVPIRFIDRAVGTSKMDGGIAREALLLVPRLRWK
jgi:dolichol-phosphate mannosyltransferase